MDEKKFRDVEKTYNELKLKLERKEITPDNFNTKLKKMMVVDENGSYWMIGGKTGKWYMYDGVKWVEKNPFEDVLEMKEEDIDDPSSTKMMENDASKTMIKDSQTMNFKADKVQKTVDFSETMKEEDNYKICKFCKSKVPQHAVYCSFCGANLSYSYKKTKDMDFKSGEILIEKFNLLSLVLFFGGVGLIIGVLFGAIFGIFDIFGDFIYQFPKILIDVRGTIQGALMFSALGGIFGFLFFAVLGIINGLFYNLISFFFSGIKVKIKS